MGEVDGLTVRTGFMILIKTYRQVLLYEFTVKPELKTLAGKPMTGQKQFSFFTGGPAIIDSEPYQGADRIDENQIFVLQLDAEPLEESILPNVSCSIEGINERVGIRILKGEEEKYLKPVITGDIKMCR